MQPLSAVTRVRGHQSERRTGSPDAASKQSEEEWSRCGRPMGRLREGLREGSRQSEEEWSRCAKVAAQVRVARDLRSILRGRLPPPLLVGVLRGGWLLEGVRKDGRLENQLLHAYREGFREDRGRLLARGS